MPVQQSAGLLMCRIEKDLEYFLVHPGGPYFKNKETGVWSIPKGLPAPGEALLATAMREFLEETGITPLPPFHSLGNIQQKGGKIVHGWCFLGDWDPAQGIVCNTFEIEWPPKSGRYQKYPEQDKAEWMNFSKAIDFINQAQIPLLERAKSIYQPT